MALTQGDYLRQFIALMPRGLAWVLQPDGWMYRVFSGIAEVFARIDARAGDLIREADPRQTYELLAEWEAMLGLPDPCSAGVNTTLQERRMAVVSKLTSTGDQSRAAYIALAAAMGYTITITEYQPFVCGLSECGVDSLWSYGHFVRQHWSVTILGPRVTHFRCGESECGIDPITKWVPATDLECRFRHLNQAHRVLHFVYLA